MMKMRLLMITVVIVGCCCCCCFWTAAGSGFGSKVGGRREIKDVDSNEEVQELGRFSVHEYNRLQGATNGRLLIFSHVVWAESQVVAGIKYYLKIEAKQRGQTRVFESEVVLQPWLHSKKLLHFSPTQDA